MPGAVNVHVNARVRGKIWLRIATFAFKIGNYAIARYGADIVAGERTVAKVRGAADVQVHVRRAS